MASNHDDTHSRICTKDSAHVETVPCSGGEATCVSPKECEICHEKYGEIDARNHADLRHIEAKEATVKSEGNIVYWYCAACDKYYRDADLTQEITKEDTVLPKLKPAVPATGDESGMGTWIIVLCISGSVLIVAAIILLCVLRKKRKKLISMAAGHVFARPPILPAFTRRSARFLQNAACSTAAEFFSAAVFALYFWGAVVYNE